MRVTLDMEIRNGLDLKESILGLPDLEWGGWLVMNGAPGGRYVRAAPMPWLYACRGLDGLLGPLHRQAENALREDLGLPWVGESWVSETELFIAIRDAFGCETPVEQHGQPGGFGRQHLDVWIPEWRVGIEYQGLQHDRPVDFFGGEEAWEISKRRDRLKRSKCTRMGIHLIEVRPGYVVQDVLDQIAENRST
jgi:hypothetical protein